MARIALFGAGKIGSMICDLLAATGDYELTVFDSQELALRQRLERCPGIQIQQVFVDDAFALRSALHDVDVLINAGPFQLSKRLAEAAVDSATHYLDLTEDLASTQYIQSLAANATTALIPQCGLAPGFISIIAHHLACGFSSLQNVHLRVGALPQFPNNRLKYNLTWSTAGLINEYLQPCEAIVNGELREVRPLEELEHFSLDGDDYEAFNTSGGLGTLSQTLAGKVTNLNYRTVRYPGHRDAMKLLLQDLRLGDDPEQCCRILERAIPGTQQDVVLIFVTVSGYRDATESSLVQETFVRKIYSQEVLGRMRSAIQLTTSASVCAVLDLLVSGDLPQQGFIRQEAIPFDRYIGNRFGRIFNNEPLVVSPASASPRSIKEA